MATYRPVFPDRPEAEEGGESWTLSYADLVTLLLCFFILLAAISSFNSLRYKEISETLTKAMGGRGSVEAVDLDKLKKEIDQLLLTPELKDSIRVKRVKRGIVVDIRGGLLFPSAEADLTEAAVPVLTRIGERLAATKYRLRVEGHTDNQPIKSEIFPSNWELSGARAAAVARFLIARGLAPERVNIVGFAETRPLAGNDTDEGRAKNRRVSLVITSKK